MGRLEDIVDRNRNSRKHRKMRFPTGIMVASFVLLILVLMIFTDLGMPGGAPPPAAPPAPAANDGRVRGLGLYVEPKAPRDAAPAD